MSSTLDGRSGSAIQAELRRPTATSSGQNSLTIGGGTKDYGGSAQEVESGLNFVWMSETDEEPSADERPLQWYGVAGVMLGWRSASVLGYSDTETAWGPRVGVGMRAGGFFVELRLQFVSISGTTVHYPILEGFRF